MHILFDLLTEAGLDLLEQQQAVEQARLLQRFKELRHWQQQQQEVLMSQQQQQLSMLRQQQEKVQSALTKQRGQQWGGKGFSVNRSIFARDLFSQFWREREIRINFSAKKSKWTNMYCTLFCIDHFFSPRKCPWRQKRENK